MHEAKTNLLMMSKNNSLVHVSVQFISLSAACTNVLRYHCKFRQNCHRFSETFCVQFPATSTIKLKKTQTFLAILTGLIGCYC